MENIVLIYNIILTILFSFSLASIYFHRQNDRIAFKYANGLLCLFILDNMMVYLSEFSSSFRDLYFGGHLIYIFLYTSYLLVVLLIRYYIKDKYQSDIRRWEYVSLAGLIVLVVGLEWVSFSLSELIVYLSFYATLLLMFYISKQAFDKKPYLRWVLIFSCFLGIMESTAYFTTYDKDLVLGYWEYRNLAFDVIKIILSISFIKRLSLQPVTKSLNLDDYNLTARQNEILLCLLEGDSNKEIAEKLFITEGTVKTHIYNIFRKTEVSNRSQLISKIYKSKE